jgi:hypothetical protein
MISSIAARICPFDQGSVIAARTAARSRVMPLAKDAMRLVPASVIHDSRSLAAFLRIIVWNLSIRPRASTSMGTPASIAAMVTVSALLR